jgi:hypothetical protein
VVSERGAREGVYCGGKWAEGTLTALRRPATAFDNKLVGLLKLVERYVGPGCA